MQRNRRDGVGEANGMRVGSRVERTIMRSQLNEVAGPGCTDVCCAHTKNQDSFPGSRCPREAGRSRR